MGLGIGIWLGKTQYLLTSITQGLFQGGDVTRC